MDRATAIDKIDKMLRSADSLGDNPEGQTARKLAERWMVEHQVTVADVLSHRRAAAAAEGAAAEFRDLWDLCNEYAQKSTAPVDGMALARTLEQACSTAMIAEDTRMRGVYLGRCGWRLHVARPLGQRHMDVYSGAFIDGLEAALESRLTRKKALVEDVLARVKPIPIPQGHATYLCGGSPQEWTAFHVRNGWDAGHEMCDKNAVEKVSETAATITAGAPQLESKPS